ncbi:BCCT family transporter [Actinomycetospora lemnae]|uniref:BCCT family transporter n=1 Tax=Actinomycetospora lemnae TaxID=3019891 RepID=A0ABT5SQ90_9PSEU|nr:BCCT family transporter [Actinomycetospora sp. DW7H6]MDD7964640.1 BCCT family transporter [Actinomycetospora sp. DW7H6]
MTDTEPAPTTDAPADERAERQFGPVFWISVGISATFVAVSFLAVGPVGAALTAAVSAVVAHLGWAYLLITSGFVVFALYLALGRFSRVRLGGPDARPEFGRWAWFAMLFQAGMGVGLLFWGVAEPVMHAREPAPGTAVPGTPEAAEVGMQYAFFHWTLHPWAVYAVVALAVAYTSFNRGSASLRLSAVLRPLLGDRVDGPLGTAVDVLAVVATLFGVAVSLGLGTLQITAGLADVFGVPGGVTLSLAVIAVTAVGYMLSASTPISQGVNRLSQLSLVLAVVLLAYFVVLGPTTFQLNLLTQETGNYLARVVPMSLRTYPFAGPSWLTDWTIFFWATWIAWAPYVGAFIARISRGRTIREFVLGVIVAPSIFSIVWFSVLGGAGLDADARTGGAIGAAAGQDEALATFRFLREYPAFGFTAVLVLVLVWIFFVAGADAGTVVLGSMSGGGLDPARRSKLTWGVIMAALAAALLVIGGLDALQNAEILVATPFALLMVAICAALYRALAIDHPRGE